MKEFIKELRTVRERTDTEGLTAIICHLGIAVAAFIASRAVVLGSVTPFGLSLLAGCPNVFTAAAATGAFLGYFFPLIEGSAFRYIAALFAILSIKLLLSGYKKITDNPLFLSLLCFGAELITCIVAFSGSALDFTYRLAEALLSAGGAFFVFKASRALSNTSTGLTPEEVASVITVISIFLMGLNNLTPSELSLSYILSSFLILTAAKFGGTLAGALSGITVAFSFLLTGSATSVTVSFALCGMMAGIFSSLGKYAQVVVVILSTFTAALTEGLNLKTVSLLIEIVLGCAIFLALPRNMGIYLGKLFSASPKIISPVSFKKSLAMRLNHAANALSDVSQTVEQVSRELTRINAPDFSTVLSRIEADTCKGCKFRMHCWESKKPDTVAAIFEMTKAVKGGELSPESFAPADFRGLCLRINRMGSSVYRHYSEYAAKISAENRLDEVRGVVTDQFDGISKMLYDLKTDFENDQRFDNSTALAAAGALKSINLRANETSCRIDKYGRMTIELKIKKNPEQKINKMQIMKLLSLVCERDFDPPVLSETGSDIFITLNERAVYKIDFGAHQLSAYDSNLCGDSYTSFYDGRGHFIIILSDGMGSGGRAAVDGAMASGLMMRLIKAGFGYDCSLRILNSSMLFKSTDESLATLDIVSIDLYTGAAELYKAGAAPTLVRRSGKTGKAQSSSLPAGILRDIGFDYANLKMKTGDIVLMVSDGATGNGTDWIRSELEAAQDISASDLAEKICESARRRRTDRHDDDITVIAAIIEKNY